MKTSRLLLIGLFFMACMSSGCALLPYSPHNEMIQNVETHVYPQPVSVLKENVVQQIPILYSTRAPRIFIYKKGGGVQIHDVPQSGVEWEKGFTYKGKFYYTADKSIDLKEVANLDSSAVWKEKITSLFQNSTAHVLEDSPTSFLIVRGNEVFKGQAVTGGSTLEVYTISNYHRGPIRVGLDTSLENKSGFEWWKFIKLRQDPIQFESSFRDYAVKKPERALAAMYVLDPDYAQKTESDLRAKHEQDLKAKHPYL